MVLKVFALSIFFLTFLGVQGLVIEGLQLPTAVAQDVYMKDTPLDTGVEPNPDTGPMWVSEDIWVRTSPDPNYRPQPFPEASPPWVPAAHENPEYRDPHFSAPSYIYVRVRNRGSRASTGNERLRVYWAKASTGLGWPSQWVDNVITTGGSRILYGAEATKPRKNAATADPAERAAYMQAILDIGRTGTAFTYPDGISFWHKQNLAHRTVNPGAGAASTAHGTPAFFPWHREMLRRYELLLQKADPTVNLLYWDWTTDPANPGGGGFNYFTPGFMGASGRGTGGVNIGLPFQPALGAPAIQRNLAVDGGGAPIPPSSQADSTLLAITRYHSLAGPGGGGLWSVTENVPNHNAAHGYIGGNTATRAGGAEDPFFFLLHGNVDRLWATWQRDVAASPNLSRLEPATVYGNDATNGNITSTMVPWNGSPGIRPWTPADGHIVSKTSLSRSVVFPPIYDTAPLRIPILQPNEAAVIEIPWFPPNPADFASFGADRSHFCLLARLETSTAAPFGMTTAEGIDINANTRANNNIVWRNITVVDNFAGSQGIGAFFIRNISDEPVEAGLRFADTGGFDTPFFDFGRISVDLKPMLFERWRAGGARGKGIEPLGNTTIGIFSPQAFIQGIRLEPKETFSVDVHFELSKDYQMVRGTLPKLDLIQTGTRNDPEAIVGGQRFEVDFSKIKLIEPGSIWRYFDGKSRVGKKWQSQDFDDSKWKKGKADLGFGNNPVTTINAGPPERRRITTYFRHTFEVEDPTFFRNLYLRLKRNDGAVVYLNGKEIHRVNLGQDPVNQRTVADRNVGGLEREIFFPVEVERGLLRKGKNVIAVEVHLASPNSTDATFDLQLYANPTDNRFSPNIAFIGPTYGALFQPDQPIPIQLEALDSDGKIAEVSFYADGKLIGRDSDPPYSVQWKEPSLGIHQLRADVLDNDKLTTTASTVITVVENTPPTVELIQPGNGSTFRATEVIPLRAEADDEGGKILRVDYYLLSMDGFKDASLVATAKTEPYETSLRDVAPGHYMLIAVAVDDGGAVSHSVPMHIDVAH